MSSGTGKITLTEYIQSFKISALINNLLIDDPVLQDEVNYLWAYVSIKQRTGGKLDFEKYYQEKRLYKELTTFIVAKPSTYFECS